MALFVDAGKTVGEGTRFSELNYSGGIGRASACAAPVVLHGRRRTARVRRIWSMSDVRGGGSSGDPSTPAPLPSPAAALSPGDCRRPEPGGGELSILTLLLSEPRPARADQARESQRFLRPSATLGRPGERHPSNGVIAAQSIRWVMLDSAWYESPRPHLLSPAELRRAAGTIAASMTALARMPLKSRGCGLARVSRREQPSISCASTCAARPNWRPAPRWSRRASFALGYASPKRTGHVRSRSAHRWNAIDITSNAGTPAPPRASIVRWPKSNVSATAAPRRRPQNPHGRPSLVGPYQLFGPQRRPERHRAARTQARSARPAGVLCWLNHAYGCPPHL